MKSKIKKYFILTVVVLAGFAAVGVSTPASASEPFIGQIIQAGFNFAPRNYAKCDGQLLPIAQYTALFSLLGTMYGGDGRTIFALPDLRGRVAIHPGTGPGLSTVTTGQRGGRESVVLGVANLPAHSHTATATLKATDDDGNMETPGGHILAKNSREDDYSDIAPTVDMNAAAVTVTVGNTGGGQAVNIRQPFLGINHCIALVGIYPSRN